MIMLFWGQACICSASETLTCLENISSGESDWVGEFRTVWIHPKSLIGFYNLISNGGRQGDKVNIQNHSLQTQFKTRRVL